MPTAVSMTGAQFDALPYEEGRQWELVGGELIGVSSPTPRHQEIVFRVLMALHRWLAMAAVHGLVYADVEFALTNRDRVRPDVCVVLGDRARDLDPDQIPIPGAPDIAIEVISPTESAADSHAKVRNYLRHGSQEVWQVYPKSRTVQVHHMDTSISLEAGQSIHSKLLWEFALPLAELFD